MSEPITCMDIEIAVMHDFSPRRNLVVPNVWWGMNFNHECDILVVTKAGVGTEIEIKTNKYDLINDKKKPHGHSSHKIRRLYFAIPTDLMPYIEHIPEHAGIIEVYKVEGENGHRVRYHRTAKENGKYKFDDKEMQKLGHLGAMRIIDLKRIVRTLVRNHMTTTSNHRGGRDEGGCGRPSPNIPRK